MVVGLIPTTINYDDAELNYPEKWKNPTMIKEAVGKSIADMKSAGVELEAGWLDGTNEEKLNESIAAVGKKLKEEAKVDAIVIGAGVRCVPKYAALLEQLLDIFHTNSPEAKILFNDGPAGTTDAVRRWFKLE